MYFIVYIYIYVCFVSCFLLGLGMISSQSQPVQGLERISSHNDFDMITLQRVRRFCSSHDSFETWTYEPQFKSSEIIVTILRN